MCGSKDNKESAQKLLNYIPNTERELKNLLLNLRLKDYKIVTLVLIEDENSQLFCMLLNYLHDLLDSLKHKKKRRKVKGKPRNIENPSVGVWNDVFLSADEASGKKFGILLMTINRPRNGSFSGAEQVFKIGSLIASTFIVKIYESISENSLECLSFLNQDLSNSCRMNNNLLLAVEGSTRPAFGYGIKGGEQYLDFIINEAIVSHRQDLLELRTRIENTFHEITCSLMPNQDSADYNKTFKETFDFLLSYKNLSKSTKNGRETLESLSQNPDLFNLLNIIDEDLQTLEPDDLLPQPSCSSDYHQPASGSQSKSKNKCSRQAVEDSINSPKRSRTSEDGMDEDEDILVDPKPRACMEPRQQTVLTFFPTPSKSHRVKELKKNSNKLSKNTKTKNFETLDEVKQYLQTLPDKTRDSSTAENESIFRIPEEILIDIFGGLNDEDRLNLIFTSERFVNIFLASRTILKRFRLKVDKHNIDKLLKHPPLHRIPIINLSFDLEGLLKFQILLTFLNKLKGSIEHLEVKNADFKNYSEFLEFFGNIPNLKTLCLNKCKIADINNEIFPALPHLDSIYLNKCNDNIFKVLQHQPSITKVTVRNDDWTWKGFPHDIFNQMAKNVQHLKKITFIGSGTGSFFDSDQISFKVEVLDTTMITFNWYVGIRNGRTSFLRTQLGHLKELTIHQLPFDFDGGNVLKYIIEEMKLDSFYYGTTPLILKGKKQAVKEVEANEIQITSTCEMFRQFPAISSFRFNLSSTDISSEHIEAVINPPTDLFNGLENFEVVGDSKHKGTLGVFLGMFKNMRSLKKLSLKTQDLNINTLLAEFLPCMRSLNEVYLTSEVRRSSERLKIIKALVPNLRKLSVADEFVGEANVIFGSRVEVSSVKKN